MDAARPTVRETRPSACFHNLKILAMSSPMQTFIVGSPYRDSPMRRRMLMELSSSSCKAATTTRPDEMRSSRRPICCKTPPHDRKRMSDFQAKSNVYHGRSKPIPIKLPLFRTSLQFDAGPIRLGGEDRTRAEWSSREGISSFIDCRKLQKPYTPPGRRRSVTRRPVEAAASPKTKEDMQFELEL
eukprot:1393147-Amorphochlora_amoeboformis.AAC.1